MRKFIILLTVMLLFGMISSTMGSIPVVVERRAIILQFELCPIDRDHFTVRTPRMPKAPLTIYYSGHSLTSLSRLESFALQVTDENGNAVFSATVISDSITLPASLQGRYTLTFIKDDASYIGEIQL